MTVYHVGLCKDYRKGKGNHVTVELRHSIDFLSCELWKYLGERVTTKQHYKDHKYAILDWINRTFNTEFTKITID